MHVVAFAVLLDLFDAVVLTERRRAAALKREIFLIDFMLSLVAMQLRKCSIKNMTMVWC